MYNGINHDMGVFMKLEKKHFYYFILTFVICYAIQAYWGFVSSQANVVFKALSPFIMGAGVAYVINIVMSFYEKAYVSLVRSHPKALAFKRAIAMILAYLTFIGLILWLFSIVIPDLIHSLKTLMSIDQGALTNIVEHLNQNKEVKHLVNYLGTDKELISRLNHYGQQVLSQLLGVLTNLLTSMSTIAATILNLFISLIFSIYVLASKEKLGLQGKLLVDTYLGRHAKTFNNVRLILHHRFYHFFVGQTIEAMILGSLTALGMLIFQFPYAATVGVLVAFTALIPVIGAYIGLVVGFVLIATQSVSDACLFVVFLVVLQQFEGNLIYPKVVGGSIGLPGMWVLLAVTLGGALGGILGILLAVPLAATFYQLIKDYTVYRHQQKKNSHTH